MACHVGLPRSTRVPVAVVGSSRSARTAPATASSATRPPTSRGRRAAVPMVVRRTRPTGAQPPGTDAGGAGPVLNGVLVSAPGVRRVFAATCG